MGKILPLMLALAGLGAGAGAGLLLRPEAPDPVAAEAADQDETGMAECPPPAAAHPGGLAGHAEPEESEFVKLNNQFVVPVMDGDGVTAMVVMSLSVEAALGSKEQIFQREPKLRDAFLRVLFDHSNAGGFDGNFTRSTGLDQLRFALRESAVRVAGPVVYDVLIVDLVKQDV